MRKIEELEVKYMGYQEPNTEDEVILEILGLELAIKIAEQRIALLRQGLKVGEMVAKNIKDQSSQG